MSAVCGQDLIKGLECRLKMKENANKWHTPGILMLRKGGFLMIKLVYTIAGRQTYRGREILLYWEAKVRSEF